MLFKIAIAVSLICPLIGALLLEFGVAGPDIGQNGHMNGATLALGAYSLVLLGTIFLVERYKVFHAFGRANAPKLPQRPLSIATVLILFLPMAVFIAFMAGGWQTIMGMQGSGQFRMSLTTVTGVPAYLIAKYYAPATFAYVALEQQQRGTLFSAQTVIAGLFLVLISISFGYKTAIVLAMSPAVTVLCWRSSLRTMLPLGAIAGIIIVLSYLVITHLDLSDVLYAIYQRLFLWTGGTTWKIWDLYVSGTPLPSYADTLLPIFSDRLFTFVTGITRADETAWVMAHFSLMATHLAGYTPEYILSEGHNNAANAFSEGLIALGPIGVLLFAVLGGLITNALYHLIDNRLEAKDFAAASIGACYLFFALQAWLIGGGLEAIMHFSVILGTLSCYVILWIASRLNINWPAFCRSHLR